MNQVIDSISPVGAQARRSALFLPCAAQTETYLQQEVLAITALAAAAVQIQRGGVRVEVEADRLMQVLMQINLCSRLAQRVLVAMADAPYRTEDDIYALASSICWEDWFTPRERFKIEFTAHKSPLTSLNFAALRVKDAVADRFRSKSGSRPSVDTRQPDVRIHMHLDAQRVYLSLDTSGEPLFKRGWREDKGDAPLKETLAASMIAATGWQPDSGQAVPLYDPCCGSGTIAIEAAQMACRMAPGMRRRFAFERLRPFERQVWLQMKEAAKAAEQPPQVPVFGSDIAHRMVDFAKRNAERAGVAHALQLRGGDALQRQPPSEQPGLMLLNPPYGTRLTAAGQAGRNVHERRLAGFSAREFAEDADGSEFFARLAAHWKRYYGGWSAWLLTPDMKLPGKLRLNETRRVPMWNGPIDCRLFRFNLRARSQEAAG